MVHPELLSSLFSGPKDSKDYLCGCVAGNVICGCELAEAECESVDAE